MSTKKPSCKEVAAAPELLAALHTYPATFPLPSLADHRISVLNLESKRAIAFTPFRNVSTLAILSVMYARHVERVQKDGHAIVWADAHEYRVGRCIRAIYAIAYDFDGTAQLLAVIAVLKALGFTCLVHTTYSHGSTRCEIDVREYQEWAAENNESFPPTPESLGRFAKLKGVIFDLDKATDHLRETDDGCWYVAFHDPIDRFRVIVFLKTPIPLSGEDGVGIDGYKAIYEPVGVKLFGPNALSLIDLSCRTPAQPIYTPAKPKGSTSAHSITPIDGELFDWRTVWAEVQSEVEERRARLAERRAAFADAPHDQKINDLKACLHHISAEHYLVWFKVLAIIHHETDGCGEGLALAHNWSSSAPEKYDPDAVDEKWDELDRSGYSGQRAGIGSLVHMAREHFPGFVLRPAHLDCTLLGY